MTVLHAEAAGYNSKLRKSELFVKLHGRLVCFNNGIELQYTVAKPFRLLHAVRDKRLAYMLSP